MESSVPSAIVVGRDGWPSVLDGVSVQTFQRSIFGSNRPLRPCQRPLRARAKTLTRKNRTIRSPSLPSRTIPLLARQNLPRVSLRGPCRPAALSGREIWPIVAPNPRSPSPLLSPPLSPWSSQWRGLRVISCQGQQEKPCANS